MRLAEFEALPLTLTVEEFSELVGRCDRKTTYEMVKTGEIRSVKVGRSIRIPKPAVAAWLGYETDERGHLRLIEGGDPDG